MLISVCIPTYSRLHYLKQAVASAQSQTYSDVEICVSQNPKANGADQAIKAWCEELATQNILRYNLNEKNFGLSGNLNVLAKFAKGEYVIFLGDDDLLHKNYIAVLADAIKNTYADVAFSNQFFIDKNGELLQVETTNLNHKYKRDILDDGIIEDTIQTIFENSVPLSSSLIRRKLLYEYSFNEKLNTPELPFFLRIAVANCSFVYVKQQLAYYRLHQNSETFNGLATDELLKDIMALKVPAKFEAIKRNFISGNIIPAINKAFMKGNTSLANQLLLSGYYPRKPFKKMLQKIISYMPVSIVKQIFKLRKAASAH